MSESAVGKRMPRTDAISQVLGRVKYGDDMPPLPGMLYAKVLKSKVPHAEDLKINTDKAEGLSGVKAVITAKDVPGNAYGQLVPDQFVCAQDRIRYVGEPLAVVAAESAAIAEKAIDLIDVKYREIPAVFDPREAMKPDAPKVHPPKENILDGFKLRRGDVDKGFSESDSVFEDHFETPMVEHCSMETHVGTAVFDDVTGKVTIWTAIQVPWIVRAVLQHVLHLPATKIRIIVTPVGGAFGGKNEPLIEHHLALLAMKTKRPVRMTLTRKEEFEYSSVRQRMYLDFKTGVKKDGTLVASQVKVIIDNGAGTGWGVVGLKKGFMFIGPYRIPNVKIDNFLVYTNTPIQSSMRGYNQVQAAFASEVHYERIARSLGMDSVQFRLKNALKDGDTLPTGQVLHGVGITECIQRVAEAAGWR